MMVDSGQTTCNFYAKGSAIALPAKGSCKLTYSSKIPTLPDNISQKTYLDTVFVTSQIGYTARYTEVGVKVNQQSRVYITGDSQEIRMCDLNPISGKFINCVNANSTMAYPGVHSDAIVLSPDGKHAYIADTQLGNGKVYSCSIDQTTGKFTSCPNSGATPTGSQTNPESIALTNNGTRISIVYGDNTVTTCRVDNVTGLFSQCLDASPNPSTFSAVFTIAYSPDGKYAYVGGSRSSATIYSCKVNQATGKFTSCNNFTPPAFFTYTPTNISLTNYGTRAGITNGNAFVTTCSINNATGNFSQCIKTDGNPKPFTVVDSMVYTPDGKYADVIDMSVPNKIYVCNVNQVTGEFNNCTDLDIKFSNRFKHLAFTN